MQRSPPGETYSPRQGLCKGLRREPRLGKGYAKVSAGRERVMQRSPPGEGLTRLGKGYAKVSTGRGDLLASARVMQRSPPGEGTYSPRQGLCKGLHRERGLTRLGKGYAKVSTGEGTFSPRQGLCKGLHRERDLLASARVMQRSPPGEGTFSPRQGLCKGLHREMDRACPVLDSGVRVNRLIPIHFHRFSDATRRPYREPAPENQESPHPDPLPREREKFPSLRAKLRKGLHRERGPTRLGEGYAK